MGRGGESSIIMKDDDVLRRDSLLIWISRLDYVGGMVWGLGRVVGRDLLCARDLIAPVSLRGIDAVPSLPNGRLLSDL